MLRSSTNGSSQAADGVEDGIGLLVQLNNRIVGTVISTDAHKPCLFHESFWLN